MRRYRQPEPSPRGVLRILGGIALWALLAALVVAGGAAGALYLRAHQFVAAISPHSPAERVAARHLNVAIPGRPTIALVLGSDFRRGGDPGGGARSDTVMLIRADPLTKSISMLSIPRDLLTTIRCPGRLEYVDRINAAFSECGAVGTLLTVRALTGLPINYLITVNFRGFVQLVDQLGGIWLDIDQRYFNNDTGPSGYSAINLQPGYQRVRGFNALAFVRFRHTDSDIYRNARQQLFLRALKQQVSSSMSVGRLLDVVSAVEHNVTVGRAGGKGISLRTLANYLYFAYTLPCGHLYQARIQGLTGYYTLSTSQTDIDAAVKQFVNPDVTAPARAGETAFGTTPHPHVLRPNRITVGVLNGNGVTGAAASASSQLSQHGYKIALPPAGQPRNAPSFNYAATTVYFAPHRSSAHAAARQIAGLFAGSTLVRPQPPRIAALANGAPVIVVVGQNFHGTIAAPVGAQTPKSEPANVTTSSGATRAVLQRLQRRTPFQLETPRLIERNSILDATEPVRLYTIVKGHKAIRLTFRSGALDYWGIEETNWIAAPALAQPTLVHHLGRREFDLYYSGSHLHMVVLREHAASYWVVNSLLDALSNETMLAIARNLVPIHQSLPGSTETNAPTRTRSARRRR